MDNLQSLVDTSQKKPNNSFLNGIIKNHIDFKNISDDIAFKPIHENLGICHMHRKHSDMKTPQSLMLTTKIGYDSHIN